MQNFQTDKRIVLKKFVNAVGLYDVDSANLCLYKYQIYVF